MGTVKSSIAAVLTEFPVAAAKRTSSVEKKLLESDHKSTNIIEVASWAHTDLQGRSESSKEKLARSDVDIQAAVNLWCSDRTKALKMYGNISEWNTSKVTTMRKLLKQACI